VAAAIDDNGGLLGAESFLADASGFEDLLGRLVGFGEVERVGVEGTGSWGVGLSRFLTGAGVVVVEVDRPNRQQRRKVGKSDPSDAVSAVVLLLSRGPSGFRRAGHLRRIIRIEFEQYQSVRP
jgi:transposase